MKELFSVLSNELRKCSCPVSGKNVVCLIQTKKNKYIGHNIEIEKPLYFFHAEEMAMAKMLSCEPTPKIVKMVNWGSGNSDSLKNVTPCFDCFEKLKLFMDKQTKIEIIDPISNESLGLTIADFQKAYETQHQTSIRGFSHNSIVKDLKKKTALLGVDLDLIADVRLLGIKERITFFLIGSVAGKGGTSKVIYDKTGDLYKDIDLLAVTSKTPASIERKMISIIKKYYKFCKLTRKECPVPSKNTTRLKRKFACSNNKIFRLIDLDIGINLEQILHKPEYIVRNWFHYLSGPFKEN